ncbi:hypothetical protein H6G76_25690 [Nostoc sp. FACHB-152]|uniref:hypothetical protein n=1 Tax=unclassified Nostoc TaxID=2593658 RepID=UPI00168974F9|nr:MULTISPECIES: hypothetical protein [unclassified Nostoc]MBD2450483.1 hypothetical protein [Nostoc sp. FACHB-152]MBD2471704.1 hypothetical protein [Nostoc sp. FACHB-145]
MSSTSFLSLEAAFAQEKIPQTSLTKVPEPTTKQLNLYGGNIIPPTTKVLGYSLNDVAKAIAYFTASGNNLAFLPQTPFQILYIQDFTNNTGTFTVRPGTILFVPLGASDNSPPVVGNYPNNSQAAANYVFGSQQLGATFEIVVDGVKTTIDDPRYIGGPVLTPGLPNGGSNFLQVGVFLTPLSPGEHTISGKFSANGQAVINILGQPLSVPFTYRTHLTSYEVLN